MNQEQHQNIMKMLEDLCLALLAKEDWELHANCEKIKQLMKEMAQNEN